MNKYFIYGKVSRILYCIVNGEVSEALREGKKLQRIHPGEEFYVLEAGPDGVPLNLSTQDMDELLKAAIRVEKDRTS